MAVSIKSGSQCLDLVSQVSTCYKSDPIAAQQHLEVVKQSTPIFLEELKKIEKEHENKRDELKREENSIQYQINSKEREQSRLRDEIMNIEARRARHEAQLEDRKRDLRAAEEEKRKAESAKDAAVAGTVVGGVGAVVLGIFFPPSLAVTVPTVAAAGTVSIVEADKAVGNCRDNVRSVERLIDEDRRQIRSSNDSISNIQRDIHALQSKLQRFYSDRGKLRKTITFLQQAVTCFGELQVAVEGGLQRTELMHRLMLRINQKKQYKILNSQGVAIVANSFAEAWKTVEEAIMSGNQAAFLNIVFEEIPELQY